MGLVEKVAAPEVMHPCLVPALAGLGKGTVWECAECKDVWKLKSCFGEYEMYLEWCRVSSKGKRVGFLSKYRFPTRRQSEPTQYDLQREQRSLKMLDELKISTSVIDVIKYKNPSAHAPYHGYQHLLTVALNCKEAAEYHELEDTVTRPLVLAALFHDYGHLLNNTVKDAVNIEAAVAGVVKHLPGDDATITSDEIESVVSIIRATEYPHGAPLGLSAQIIQDADMMQTLEPDGQRFLAGLGVEKGRRITVKQNDDFLETYPGNTEWGRKKLHPLRVNQ